MRRNYFGKKIVYRELTSFGVFFCALAGLIAEAFIFFITGIKPLLVPAPVFLFLWLLSGIIVSGILYAAAVIADLLGVLLTDTGDDGMISACDTDSHSTISHIAA